MVERKCWAVLGLVLVVLCYAPVAWALTIVSPKSGAILLVGNSYNFEASVTCPGYSNVQWSFGDGKTGSGASCPHTYLEPSDKQPNEEYIVTAEDSSSGEKDEIRVKVIKAQIDGYINSESGRKFDNIVDEPAVVVSSGWVRFAANVTRLNTVPFKYEWKVTGGNLDPRDTDKEECDWDAPSAETATTLSLIVKKASNNEVVCQRDASVTSVTPKIVKVWFKDDGGGDSPDQGNEHTICEGANETTPEYDSEAKTNYPTCYTMGTTMWMEADAKASGNLTKKTPIRISLESALPNRMKFHYKRLIDENTVNWETKDFKQLYFGSARALPKEINQYLGFVMEWKIECVSWSQGDWVDVYTGKPDVVSQKTTHLACYTIYSNPKCAKGNFKNNYLLDVTNWAKGEKQDQGVAKAICEKLKHGAVLSHYSHTEFDLMWRLAKSGSGGQCCCWSQGMVYMMEVLGFEGYRVVYCNMRPAYNIEQKPSGAAYCKHWTPFRIITLLGWDGTNFNTYQAAAHGGGQLCYCLQGGLVKTYEQLGYCGKHFNYYSWCYLDMATRCQHPDERDYGESGYEYYNGKLVYPPSGKK